MPQKMATEWERAADEIDRAEVAPASLRSTPATRPRSPRPRTSSRAASGGPAGSGRNAPRGPKQLGD